MSASEPADLRGGWSADREHGAHPTVQALLLSAIREAVDDFDAVVSGVYFLDEPNGELAAAMIGGTSPALVALPERTRLDSPYTSAQAFRSGRPVTTQGPEIHRKEDDLVAFLSSYSVIAAPITHDGRRLGVLTMLCGPVPQGSALEAARSDWLGDRARSLGGALTLFAGQFGHLGPPSRPSIVPLHRHEPPRSAELPGWGLPDIPGSSGLTFIYQVLKLHGALNRALTTEAVTDAAARHLMVPFHAQEMALATQSDGRLWVVGHRGRPTTGVREVHGSRVDGDSPAARVLRQGKPIFYSDSVEPAAGNPWPPEDERASWAVLPVKGSQSPIGVCGLGFDTPHHFAAEERAVLMVMAGMLGATLERVALAETEHEVAQSLQKRLLPRSLSQLPEVVVAARYLPACATARSGGDWYDVVRLSEDRIALIVGDVEGHGVESATVMGQVRTSVLAYIREGHTPAAVLDRASRLLGDLDTELFATACVLYLDGTTGVATYCLAGHPRPVCRGPEGLKRPLEGPAGVPLGVRSELPYQNFECTLDSGTLMFLYTNGIADGSSLDSVSYASHRLDELGYDLSQNLEMRADKLVAALPPPQTRTDDAVVLLARYEGPRLKESRRFGRLDIQRRDLRGVADARKFVRTQLESWDRDRLVDALELIASELTTNALIHADSDVQLRLREFADHIGLEVIDSDAAPPVPAFTIVSEEDSQQSEHGRGLIIVDALASAFGSSPNGRGKTVWVEVATG